MCPERTRPHVRLLEKEATTASSTRRSPFRNITETPARYHLPGGASDAQHNTREHPNTAHNKGDTNGRRYGEARHGLGLETAR